MYRTFVYAFLCIAFFGATCFGDTIHKVRKGETLSKIATAYKVTVKSIKDANNISNANQIRIGQNLKIPVDAPSFINYKIRNGDSLSNIAKKHGVSLRELSAYNNIRNANKIRVGQVIKIPIQNGSTAAKPSAITSADLTALNKIKPKSGQWKHIVIHHSGGNTGSAKIFDRIHREDRRMENGLAYHFVIGNGRGMKDGELHIGDRWKRQIQGGHLSSFALNQISIGICLVGNFENSKPSKKQMDQLEALVKYLMAIAKVPAERVTTHTLIHPKHTACPGKHFPTSSFKRAIRD